MEPVLSDEEYVFLSVDKSQHAYVILEAGKSLNVAPLLQFHEKEGVTIVFDKSTADSLGLEYFATWSMITLSVHSDLEAVGFIARVASELAREGISVNVVSAYYHDHLFVSAEDGQEAMEILQALSENP
jgi:hypothetical protein